MNRSVALLANAVAVLLVASGVVLTPDVSTGPARGGTGSWTIPTAETLRASLITTDLAGGYLPAISAVTSTGARGSGTVTVTARVVDPKPPKPALFPVYRFYSRKSGTHFYTPSLDERDMVMVRWPDVWAYEGIAYWVNPAKNSQPLYRFYNRANGSHFYTASPAERDMVFARWMNVFQYDGPTYAVSPSPSTGRAAVYRFFNLKNGSHFYTASPEERDIVIARWSNIYRLEGAAFWLGQ